MNADVTVGRIARAHGIRGDVLVTSLSDNPDRFVRGAVFASDQPGALTVVQSRPHQRGYIVTFDEIADRTAAEALVGTVLTIAASERRNLDDDEYWPDQLIGVAAVRPDGEILGTVSEVVSGAAQDRLVVTTPTGELVDVPFVSAIVGEVGTEQIVIDPPLGLFPE